jgi:glutathione synthase/RimK-type ligase-like ATP-grasp enzyme
MSVKIGLIVGREESFPKAFLDRVNSKGVEGITAELVELGGTATDEAIPYRLIVDRMSQEVPYYRLYLKKAVADGVIVVNNPFWWTADDKFFECVLAQKLGVAIPRTVALPNKSYQADVIPDSFRNLVYPLDWDGIVSHVGLPAVLKPAIGGGWKNVFVVHTIDELMSAYDSSGELQMILQEYIRFDDYARCFVIGRRDVLVSRYDPTQPHHLRYRPGEEFGADMHGRIVRDCLTLCRALGYDMNTVEFAIRDGIPYAIDFLNPAPDFEYNSIQPQHFEWVVEHMATMVIDYALGKDTVIGEEASLGDMRWQTMINATPPIAASP